MQNLFKQQPSLQEATRRGELVQALLGSTPAMIEAGKMYLPQYAAEAESDYQARLQGGILLGAYRRTRGYITGMIFSQNVTISDDSPSKERFQAIEYDVDLRGNNLRTWAQELFEAGVDDGMVAVLVDFPRIQTRTSNGRLEYFDAASQEWLPKTAATDEAMGWRPYFTMIRQGQILGYRYQYEDGRQVLTQIRILERVVDEQGDTDADDKEIEQVRLMEPGRWQTWRKGTDKTGKDSVFLYEEGTTSLNVIPVAFYVTGERIGLGAAPGLEDLAMLNKRHWQATCDQHALMSYVRRPPWFGKLLVHGDAQVEFGPGRLCHASDPSADLRSVGIDVGSVEAGRGELKDIEERMSLYGLMMLTPTLRASGGKTATQAQQESSEFTSQIKDWAKALQDCLDNCFRFASLWLGIEDGQEPAVKVNQEFQPGLGLEPSTLILAYEKGILPRQIVFDELKRRGMLSDVLDWQEVQGMIDSEMVAPAAMPGSPLDFLQTATNRERQLTGDQADQTRQS